MRADLAWRSPKLLTSARKQQTNHGSDMKAYDIFLHKAVNSLAVTFRKRAASGLQSGRGFVLPNAQEQVHEKTDLELLTWFVITENKTRATTTCPPRPAPQLVRRLRTNHRNPPIRAMSKSKTSTFEVRGISVRVLSVKEGDTSLTPICSGPSGSPSSTGL